MAIATTKNPAVMKQMSTAELIDWAARLVRDGQNYKAVIALQAALYDLTAPFTVIMEPEEEEKSDAQA